MTLFWDFLAGCLLVCCHVPHGGDGFGNGVGRRSAPAFWSDPGPLGGLYSGDWIPRQRLALVGCPSGQCGCRGPVAGHAPFGCPLNRSAGSPCGTSVEIGEEDHAHEGRWRMGQLGGGRSLEHFRFERSIFLEPNEINFDRPGCEGHEGQDFEVRSSVGPRRRRRVRGLGRRSENDIAPEVHRDDGISARGGGGAYDRAAFGPEEETVDGETSIRGLWRVRAIRKEGIEGFEVQDLGTDGRGLCVEGASGSCQLHSMESVLQGVHDGDDHAPGMRLGPPPGLRAVCGEADPAISRRLAPGVRGGRDGSRGVAIKAEVEGGDGSTRRKASAVELRREETMGSSDSHGAKRNEILAGPDTQSSPHVACERSERKSNDPSGVNRRERTTRRHELIDASDGVGDVWLNFTGGYTNGEKARKQRQKRGEEEEMAGGKRRASKTPRSPKRVKLGEKRRRKGRRQKRKGGKTGGIHLLLVEQREQSVWIIATRSGVHEHGEADAQVLILWVARSPSNQMSGQEVKSTGDGSAAGDEGEEKKKEEDEGEEKGEEKEKEEKSSQERLDEKIQKYVKARRFRFLHHFAGPRDPLGAAIHQVAAKRGLNVEVIAAEKDWGQDLCMDEPYNTHLKWAKEGLIDGYRSGFPCSTFSRLRFRDAPNLPKPVRTRSEPHGKKSNSQAQQAECDRGTVMLARSVQLAEELVEESHLDDSGQTNIDGESSPIGRRGPPVGLGDVGDGGVPAHGWCQDRSIQHVRLPSKSSPR